MQQLNFPAYSFRFKNSENKQLIFDVIRKKFVVLTPEEWVRQHVVRFLVEDMQYPLGLINVEKKLVLNHLTKRYDVVVFNNDGSVWMIVECKAPHITIDQCVFDQIAQYNMTLNSKYLLVTNGLDLFTCSMDFENKRYIFLRELPFHPNFNTKENL